MTFDIEKTLKYLLILTCGVLAAIALWFIGERAFHAYFADSEIWGFTSSSMLWKKEHLYLWSKPLFHLLSFGLVTPSSTVESLLYGRLAYLLIFIFSVLIFMRLARHFVKDPVSQAFCLLLLLSSTLALNHGVRIRSDNLALLFYLLSLSLLFTTKHKKWIFLTLTLCFLSTPKAIYFIISIMAYFTKSDFIQWRVKLKRLNLSLGKVMATLVAFGFLLVTLLVMEFHSPLRFFLGTFFSGDTPLPWTLLSFQYLIEFALRNPLHLLGLFASWLYLLWQNKKSSFLKEDESRLLRTQGVLVLFILLHNHRVPFFIYAFSFSLYLVPLVAVGHIFKQVPQPRRIFFLLFLLLFLPFALALPYRFLLDAEIRDTNRKQLAILPPVQKELHLKKQFRVYEMTGLFLGGTSLPLYVGPGEFSQINLQKSVINHFDPQIVFPHIRFFNFNGFFEDRFSHYVDLGSQVKGQALEITLGNKTLTQEIHRYYSVDTLFYLLQLLMNDQTLHRAHFYEPVDAQVGLSQISLLGEDLQLRPLFATQSLNLKRHREDVLRVPVGPRPLHFYSLPHFYAKGITDFMDLNNYDFGW